ncbi:N-terminal EF-hand calcium-binding protein 2 [Larimichthys crocea]|uniref:Uncharacterized protein n=1 Tax=Larimichthys crocea TaxID=215358 RepID=A0ACD3QEU6_LARCR|nr:N-terminal EF-hand calcium-binding protein 2 [Larimichthys crocea]
MKKSGEGRTDEGGGENERRLHRMRSMRRSPETIYRIYDGNWRHGASVGSQHVNTMSATRTAEAESFITRSLLLIRQEMVVSQKKLGEFCEALKQYLKNVSTQRDCFHVTAVRLPDGLSFVVYEFWDGEEEWKRKSWDCKNESHQQAKKTPVNADPL